MDILFSKVEMALFQVTKQSLFPQNETTEKLALESEEWSTLVRMAEKQGILPCLYTELCEKQNIQENLKHMVEVAAKRTVQQQYRLLFLGKYLTGLFMEHQIPTVLMKGVTIGAYYPVPELRKSGDVDLLLLNAGDVERAKTILKQEGYTVDSEQHALHHIGFSTPEGIEIELHTMLAEPFDNEKTNTCLKEALQEAAKFAETAEIMGVELPVLPKAYFAFELLLHMLQHFLREGFGLKLLCDWVLLWQKEWSNQEKEIYLNLLSRAGIRGFSDTVTLTCVHYLGLSESLISWMDIKGNYPVEEFMRETFDAEEFGKSNKNRMVVMRGTGLFDYVREFHHQMQLNYPKAGKCFLLWPVLWIMTLLRFMNNNRKLRRTSTGDILKEAKRRSRMMREIRLFR